MMGDQLFLAYLDEAGHTDRKNFTVCGMTIFPLNKISDVCNEVEALRTRFGFAQEALLKFASTTRPKNVDQESHTDAKKRVIEIAKEFDAVFIGYSYFNEASWNFDADRNRLFGINTLLSSFNKFLEGRKSKGIAIIDRLDLSKKKPKSPAKAPSYKDAFGYIREKHQKGNYFEKDETWKELDNILSFCVSCEGASHLSSVNDVLTGSLLYLVNGDKPEVRKQIQDQLQGVMYRSSTGIFREHGLILRPKDKSKLAPEVAVEYENLRDFLNR